MLARVGKIRSRLERGRWPETRARSHFSGDGVSGRKKISATTEENARKEVSSFEFRAAEAEPQRHRGHGGRTGEWRSEGKKNLAAS